MNLFLNQFSNDWKKIEISPFLTDVTNMDGISGISMCTSRVQKQVCTARIKNYIHSYILYIDVKDLSNKLLW